MTRDQVVQMKQNANTPVTQLQYFHMHMLQTCLGRTTRVFAQCHTLEDQVPFLTYVSAKHYIQNHPPRREI